MTADGSITQPSDSFLLAASYYAMTLDHNIFSLDWIILVMQLFALVKWMILGILESIQYLLNTK